MAVAVAVAAAVAVAVAAAVTVSVAVGRVFGRAVKYVERGGDIATLAGPGAAGGDDKPARLVYYHDPILQRLWRPFATMTETRRSFKKSSFKKRKEQTPQLIQKENSKLECCSS